MKVSSEAGNFGGFNLIVVDLPEGLPMLGVSSPPNVIPVWNEHKSKNIEAFFELLWHISLMMALCFCIFTREKNARDDVRICIASYGFFL